MTRLIAEAMVALGGSFALSLVAKATAVTTLTLVSARLARCSRASVRHALLATTFAVLLVLPLVAVVVPTRIVNVPIARSDTASNVWTIAVGVDRSANAADSAANMRSRVVVKRASSISGQTLLLVVWAASAIFCLASVAAGLWQIHRIRCEGLPWREGRLIAQEIERDLGIHRPVEVLCQPALATPMACGVVRPAIVFPMDAHSWCQEDLRRAMTHELEHIRRDDWLILCLARVVSALYWFHPLVWMAQRQLSLEAERACDDAVLQSADAVGYAHQLVMLAERLSEHSNRPVLAMATRSDLSARVKAVLDTHQRRGRAGAGAVLTAVMAGAGLVAVIAPLRTVAITQSPNQLRTPAVPSGTVPVTGLGASAQTAAASFSGSLADPLGRTLRDTRLTLWNVSTQQPVEGRSGRTGLFTFSAIPPGEYLLQVHEFGWQGRVTLAPRQHLNRNVAAMMGVEDEVTVYSSEAPTVLPPPPPPLPSPSSTSQSYSGQGDLGRCAQVSIFCRVTPPVQTAHPRPVYPTKQRENAVGGTVVVEGRVGTNGLIKDLRAVGPADPALASATLDALRRWQFTPMRFDGLPVEMNIRVTANFVIP